MIRIKECHINDNFDLNEKDFYITHGACFLNGWSTGDTVLPNHTF